MNEEFVYMGIAFNSGLLFSRWGPCICAGKNECESCVNANEIELNGLDWDEEFNKAMERGEA